MQGRDGVENFKGKNVDNPHLPPYFVVTFCPTFRKPSFPLNGDKFCEWFLKDGKPELMTIDETCVLKLVAGVKRPFQLITNECTGNSSASNRFK